MKEIWRDIIGYEGIYEVSNLGNVKSLQRVIVCNNSKKLTVKHRILKPVKDAFGYLKVILSKDNKQKTIKVHQLVAQSFLGHITCGFKLVVNHKDFNRINNSLDNLEIVSQRQNSNRKHIKSTSIYTGVSWHKNKNKWQSQIVINSKLKHLGYYNCEIKASEIYENELQKI